MKPRENMYLLLLMMFVAVILAVSPLHGMTPQTTQTTSGSMSWAGDKPITHPRDLHGLPLLQRGDCTDRETSVQGVCFIISGPDAIYLAFHPPGEDALFLRRLNEDGTYSTIWHRDTGAPVPAGTPL